MEFDAEETSVPIVDRSEFTLAREAITGFEPWASYDDYRSEREGRILGLAAAGQRARLALVSVRAFLEWTASCGAAPTALQLDAYAAMAVARFSTRVWRRPDQTAALSALPTVGGQTGVTVDLASYQEWLACLREPPSDVLFSDYVALIDESRGERSHRSTRAD